MNTQKLELLVESLCADELVKLQSILEKTISSVISAKDSNHKIIQRERNITSCPKCGSKHTVKNGKRKETTRQKYQCKDCKTNFSDTTNTITFNSKKAYRVWESYISCLLKGMTLSDSAKEVGISTTTSFAWRHKILKTLSKFNKDTKLSGIIESDAIYMSINLKGTKKDNMPRYSKKRTSSAFRGISNHKVCIMTATDDSDNTMFEISGLGPETTKMLTNLKDRFEVGSTLITDSKRNYDKFVTQMKMKHHYIPSGFYKSDSGHTLASLNGLHNELKTWLKKFKGVSTKHLQGYLDYFRYFKNLKYTTEYEDRINKTYCFSIPSYTSIPIVNIYNELMPIDLKKAYVDYKHGIFALAHQSSS